MSRGGGVCLLGVVFAFAMLAVGHHPAADAEEYSAYSDPGKTALSVVLSEQENARKFQERFGLGDDEMQKVLEVIREENQKIAGELAESEKIVASNKGLSDAKISEKIEASDFDGAVEGAVSETKDEIISLLPEGSEPDLKAWVDGQWRQEAEAASRESSGRVVQTKAGRTLVCKVFATQYYGYTRFEAALPHKGLKFGSRPEVPIIRGNRSIRPRIKEVGPWNTRDNYWRAGRQRTMWRSLPRCVPQAQAAYYRNYNRGRDQYGRKVTNPAGVDLTPAAARRLGLGLYENGWVNVRFPWVRR